MTRRDWSDYEDGWDEDVDDEFDDPYADVSDEWIEASIYNLLDDDIELDNADFGIERWSPEDSVSGISFDEPFSRELFDEPPEGWDT